MANRENITAWVEALRSGDYQQGKGALRRRGEDGEPDSFCCLGVACEVSGVVELKDVEDYEVPQYVSVTDSRDYSGATLPAVVMKWLGIDGRNPEVVDGTGERHTLATWNDNRDKDFDQIADMVETAYLRD